MASNQQVQTSHIIPLADVEINKERCKKPKRTDRWLWLSPVNAFGDVSEDIYAGGTNMVSDTRLYECHVRLDFTDPFLRDSWGKVVSACREDGGVSIICSDKNKDRPITMHCDLALPIKLVEVSFPGEVTPVEVELVFKGIFVATTTVSGMPS